MSDSKIQNHKKIFDISRPGSTKPSDSSRSIIVTNKPVVRDPMFTDLGPRPVARNIDGIVVKGPPPLDSNSLSSGSTQIPLAPLSKEPKLDNSVHYNMEEESGEPSQGESELWEEKMSNSNQEAYSEPSTEISENEREDRSRDLIYKKHNYSRGTTVKHKKWPKYVVIIIVILILAVIAIDLALDANLFKIAGIKPVTHFFKS
jgi:hypothetical protein